MSGEFEELEAQRRELEREFPGWHVWASPGDRLSGRVTWGARPEPQITAGSPGELARQIRAAHGCPPDGSPSLASWRSYTARRRQFWAFEEAAGIAWRKMRAEADRWRRFPKAYRGRREPEAAVAATPGPGGPDLPDVIA